MKVLIDDQLADNFGGNVVNDASKSCGAGDDHGEGATSGMKLMAPLASR